MQIAGREVKIDAEEREARGTWTEKAGGFRGQTSFTDDLRVFFGERVVRELKMGAVSPSFAITVA